MNFTDIMLDLETLGTGNNAAIIQIGAVAFNADGGFQVRDEAVNKEAEEALAALMGTTRKTVSGKITGSAVLLED
jgi:uncharacterized protein YprB with RNaseH-like and TPR domain